MEVGKRPKPSGHKGLLALAPVFAGVGARPLQASMTGETVKEEKCKYCKYWVAAVATSTGEMYGECRRYPPEMAQQGLADRSLGPPEDQDILLIGEWFVTKANSFCGEFFRKAPIPKPSSN